MGRKKTPWFLAESAGHLLCLEAKSLLVSDTLTVSMNDRVQFKFGAQTLQGEILFIGDSENEVLQKMDVLKKETKSKPADTFVEGKPRNAKLQALKLVGSCPPKATDTAESSKPSKVNAKDLKKMRLKAAHALEDREGEDDRPLAHFSQQKQSQIVVNHGSDSDTDSEKSDFEKETADTKRKGHSKDVKEMDTLATESDDSSLVSNENKNDASGKNLNMKESDKGMKKNKRCESESDSDTPKRKTRKKTSGALSTDSESEQDTQDLGNEKRSGSRWSSVDGGKKTGRPSQDEKTARVEEKTISQIDEGKAIGDLEVKKNSKLDGSSGGSSGTPKNSAASSSRSSSKKKKAKRNLSVYPGINYKYCETSKHVKKLDDNYDVYISIPVYEKAIQARTATICLGLMVDDVYTEDAIQNSSAFGFPPRGKGKAALQTVDVLPRLHPDGFEAIKAAILKLQPNNKVWRPKATDKTLTDSFSSRICRAKKRQEVSASEDDNDDQIED